MIERDISYTGPLYGRATKILRLDGFKYSTVRHIFKEFDEKDVIKIYSYLVIRLSPPSLRQE